MSEIRVLHIL